MNIYYSFNDFMNQVIKKADDISRQNHNRGLEELFDVSRATFDAVAKLIKAGWYVFMGVMVLMAFGYFGFLAAIAGFLLTPIGLIVAAIFGAAAVATLKKMYDDKILPNAVRDVGEQYKRRWNNANGNFTIIDNLLNQAANDLYQKAYQQAMALHIIN